MKNFLNVAMLSITSLVLIACDPVVESENMSTGAASMAPTFIKEEGWGTLPNDMVLGSVSAVAIDANDNVWVIHRPRSVPELMTELAAPAVVKFDLEGNMLTAWGGPSDEFEWPQNEHGIHIAPDGNVWVSGTYCTALPMQRNPINDDHILEFTATGEFVQQIGRAGQSGGNEDTENFHRVSSMQVTSANNEIFVADGYGNHRVMVMDADTGEFKRAWGAFGMDTSEIREKHGCGLALRENPPPWADDQFSIVHSIVVSEDGKVYIADRENGRVQIFTTDGDYLDQIDFGADGNPMTIAFSPDTGQKHLYIWSGGQIHFYDRLSLEEIDSRIDNAGTIGMGHSMAVDSQGNIYMARLPGGIEKLSLVSPQ